MWKFDIGIGIPGTSQPCVLLISELKTRIMCAAEPTNMVCRRRLKITSLFDVRHLSPTCFCRFKLILLVFRIEVTFCDCIFTVYFLTCPKSN